MNIILAFSFIIFANTSYIYDSTLSQKNLLNEYVSSEYQNNLNGFLENTKFIPDKNPEQQITYYEKKNGFIVMRPYTLEEVDYFFGEIHNILISTLYHCDAEAPRAKTFTEALDGKHTYSSEHYSSFLHSALDARGIETMFVNAADKHYGLYYKDEKTGKELYWSVYTHLQKDGAECTPEEFVEVYNKNKNEHEAEISVSDLKIISPEEFRNTDFSKIHENQGDTQSYTQGILAPKDDNLEIVSDGVEFEGDEQEEQTKQVFAATEPEKPILGIAAIKNYQGSVDIFNSKGQLYADYDLSDEIKYSTVTNSSEFLDCITQNNIRDKRFVFEFNIDETGAIQNFIVNRIQNQAFQTCVSNLWLNDIKVDTNKIKEPVKILQIIKI